VEESNNLHYKKAALLSVCKCCRTKKRDDGGSNTSSGHEVSQVSDLFLSLHYFLLVVSLKLV
jgi:hypothetical protein